MRHSSLTRYGIRSFKLEWQLLVLLMPAIVYFVLFHYIPIYGVVISFKNMSAGNTISTAPWVGFKWFEEFLISPYFYRSLKNTLILSVYSIIFFFPLPVLFALLLNEIRNNAFKRITQTITYFPYFISTVIVVGIMINFLNPETGIVNKLMEENGFNKVFFFQSTSWFRPLYILSDIWQGLGWNAIIYIAALSSVNLDLYEAAKIDGASRIKQIFYISIPGILPTIIVLLILRVGSLLSIGFEKVMLMYNPVTYDVADIISTYVYRTGIVQGRLSYASAIGLFNSLINFTILIIFNRISKKVSETSLW